jgi:hypothetical protein
MSGFVNVAQTSGKKVQAFSQDTWKLISSKIAMPVIFVYLMIGGSFTDKTFGCDLKLFLQKHTWAQHILVLILVFFMMLSSVGDSADYNTLPMIAAVSAGVYVWYFLTTRTHFSVMLGIIFSLLTSYVASTGYTRELKNPDANPSEVAKYKSTQDISAAVALILTVGGSLLFLIMKKGDVRDKISSFFSGQCEEG